MNLVRDLRRSPWLPLALCLLLLLGMSLALAWPLPLCPGSCFRPNTFGASHAWGGQHLWYALLHQDGPGATARAGYPWLREARFIGWVPLLATWPLRPFISALTAHHLLEVLALPMAGLAAWPLLRSWTDARPWTVAAACLVYAVTPYTLGTLAMGELPKLQIWCFPLFLLAAQRALTSARAGRWLLAVAALALATSFSSPYYGLALPLLAGALALADSLRRRRVARPLLLLVTLAAALIPAWAYYRGGDEHIFRQLFMPAMRQGLGHELPSPSPVAELDVLFLGPGGENDQAWAPRHECYLGLVLLLGTVAFACWRPSAARGRWAGLALLLGGVLLALGPRLALGGGYLDISLPVCLLELARYPYARGGLYFRLVVLAGLGVSLWLTAEGARRHPALVWLLAALHIGDSLRATAPWPLRVEPVRGVEFFRAMAGAQDGAVLHLPLQEGYALAIGQRALLAAALHERPTTALPRDSLQHEIPVFRQFWLSVLAEPDPRAVLRQRGVRYVVLDGLEADRAQRFAGFAQALGAPDREGEQLRIWDLGPVELQVLPIRDVALRRARARPGNKEAAPGDGRP